MENNEENAKATEAVSNWEPNPEMLQMLVSMGINKYAAEHALYYTGNQSADAAASYVFDNPDIDVMPPVFLAKSPEKKSENESDSSTDDDDAGLSNSYKMIFVVNVALNMGVGKIAAQVAHAALGIYRLINQFDHMQKILEEWETDGEKKIVLRGDDHLHLQKLEKLAKSNELFSYLIHDAGRTQVPPNSVTVLALFGPCQRVDPVTGSLKLL